ncbi:MAG TPA: PEP-CTERM sorting domain-containing protein [Pirellulales bacterium]|jgi:hypothetical protein
MRCNLLRTLVIAALGLAAISNHASAGPVTFTIDPTQSSLQAIAYLGGPPSGGGTQITTAQSGTSDTTSLYGSLVADTAAAGGNISFPGGSNVNYTYQPGNFLPDANGGDATGPDPAGTGGAPAQFGLLVNIPGLATGYISISSALSDISDFSAGGTPLSGGSFDATQQNVLVTQGSIAYWISAPALSATPLFGSSVIAPPTLAAQNGVDSAGNSNGQVGSVTTIGGVTTITLPIFADQVVSVSGLPVDVVFTGQIVATATVPEPTTFALAGFGIVGLMLVATRRLRRS